MAKADQSARSSLKYKPHSFKIVYELWIYKSLIKDAYFKSQASDKLFTKRFGSFKVLELVRKNAVKLKLPNHFKIHYVFIVINTVFFYNQNSEIAPLAVDRPDPLPTVEGIEYAVVKILKHGRKARGFQFITLMKGDLRHGAE